MKSGIAESIRLETHPVALVWADEAPPDAVQFKKGRWGCVLSLLATVAARGKTAAFDRETFGCWGGGVGLGFGNQYEAFPGGIDGLCRFLSDGEEEDDIGGRAGERYVKDAESAGRWLEALPLREIPAKVVVAKPLIDVDAEIDAIQNVTFFANPDQLSALVVMANHVRPEKENVGIPYAAACQLIGILAYEELERDHPRALVGLTDISARKNTRRPLGSNVLSFTAPWPMFLEMEAHASGSFLSRETWRSLQAV